MSDEFDGMGGSYTVHSKTGKRRLVHRTQEGPAPTEPQRPNETVKEEAKS